MNLKQEIHVLSSQLLMNVRQISEEICHSLLSFVAVPISEKKFVFITARIHPGETNSSYMMRGLLEFITSEDKIAKVIWI